MATVYPEILLQSDPIVKQTTPNPTFYFRSKSGLVTKIQAHSKEAAIHKYKNLILPTFYLPGWCGCMFEKCGGRYCHYEGHYLSSAGYNNETIKIVDICHGLLTRYPDCDILTRFRIIYWENPKIDYDDWTTISENPNGTKTMYDPQTQVLHWKKANIRVKVKNGLGKGNSFDEALKLLTGHHSWWSLCFAILEETISHLKPDQIDKLAGSFEPTTEPPANPERQPEPEISTWSRRSQRLRRRFNKQTYDAIELSGIQPSIHP